jgi:uncharacterized protein
VIILLHSSKTMKTRPHAGVLRQPQLIKKVQELDMYLKRLAPSQLAKVMHISPSLANKTQALIAAWTTEPARQSLAIDSFVGDIYSGLRASELTAAERDYADETLYILSGLYGVIRPYDGICPYRLEMGYKLGGSSPYSNLYSFWDDAIAKSLPGNGLIVNLSSVEYSQTVTKFVDPARVVSPKFLTIDPKTGEPAFVVVHAKIARGAFARWLIQSRVQNSSELNGFREIGYEFNEALSTPAEPAFVCKEFGGKGLSMRLS